MLGGLGQVDEFLAVFEALLQEGEVGLARLQ
jgi:hypothetical protein